jgi:large subunit ribosomal protein L24e
MVLKRQCSFCAGEVEPGTGTMFVKRDGSVFYFCSSSCRKQQLHLGRVGHRLKWTRAHSLKRAAEQSSATGRAAARVAAAKKAAAPAERPAGPAKAETEPSAAAPPAEAPAKKPRARKPKAPAATE